MSFILEALKKSEKERQQGEIPGMQTLQTAASAPAPLRRWWPMLLLAALLLNALCLLWWLHPWQKMGDNRPGRIDEKSRTGNARGGSFCREIPACCRGERSQAVPAGWTGAGRME